MRPASAGLAYTSRHDQHIDYAAIGHIHVVPVVNPGTNNHHGTPFGFLSIVSKFTRYLDNFILAHASDFLCPGRRKRYVFTVVLGHVIATQPSIKAVVSAHQVKYGCYQSLLAISQSNPFSRYSTCEHIASVIDYKIVGCFSTKVWEIDGNDLIVIDLVDKAKLKLYIFALSLLL